MKGQNFTKESSLKRFLAFKNGVKSIQTAGYNGARKVNGTFVLFGNILLKKKKKI